jgi:hypothetical protein
MHRLLDITHPIENERRMRELTASMELEEEMIEEAAREREMGSVWAEREREIAREHP